MSIWVHLFRWIFPVLLDIPCFISFHFNRIVSLCPTTSEPVVLLTSIYLVCAAAHGTPCNRGKCFSPVIFCICLCLFKSLPMNIFVHFLLHYSVSCTIRAGPILQFIGEIKIMKSSCYVFWDAFLWIFCIILLIFHMLFRLWDIWYFLYIISYIFLLSYKFFNYFFSSLFNIDIHMCTIRGKTYI